MTSDKISAILGPTKAVKRSQLLVKLKDDRSIRVDNLGSAIHFALGVANDVWRRQGVPHGVTVTSGNEGYPGDGTHSYGSLHYPQNTPDGKGRAVDLRIWDVDAEEAVRKLREYLPNHFDIVLEEHHVHIEYDPEDGEQE